MKHRTCKIVAAFLCGIVGCGMMNTAYGENAVFVLDGVTVTGERHKGRDIFKYNEKAEKIPFSYSVIDEKDLKQRGVSSLKDSLNYTAGVVGTITDQALFNNSTIRGFEVDHTNVTLNGMKMFGGNDRRTGYSSGIDTLYSPEMSGLESVTIAKGAESVHHGAASPGGSIDLQLKKAKLFPLTKGEVKFGSKSQNEETFDINRPLTDHSAFRITAVHRKYDLDIEKSSTERWYVAPTYHWEVKDKMEFDVYAYWQKDYIVGSEEPLKEKIPSMSSHPKEAIFSVPSRLFFGISGKDGMDLENRYIGYQWERPIRGDWRIHQNAGYMKADAVFRKTGVMQIGKQMFFRDYTDTTMKADSFSMDTYIYKDVKHGDVHHHFLAGVDLHRQSWRFRTLEKRLSPWMVSDILKGKMDVGEINDTTKWNYIIQNKNTSWEKAFYVQNVYEKGKVSFNTGFRHTGYTTGEGKKEVFTVANTWQAGVSYDHGKGWHSYANHATSFKPNNGMYTIQNEEVGPTCGVQSEIGLKYESPHTHLHGTLAAFHIEKQNYPVGLRRPQGLYTTVDQMISKGIELELHGEINENLELSFSYTYADRIYKGLKPGIESIYLGGVPKHAVSLWLDTETEDREKARWNGGLGLRFLGERWCDDKIHTLSPVLLVDASLRYKKDSHSIRLDVKNLFDTHYYTAVRIMNDVPYGFVGDQRQVTLGYSYEW